MIFSFSLHPEKLGLKSIIKACRIPPESMRLRALVSVMSAAITLLLPALAAVQHTAQGGDGPAGQLLRVTNEMWLLLSGVVNRETAEKAAAPFVKLAKESASLSDKMFDGDARALDVEALDRNAYRIAESYDELCQEFSSLCHSRCYGSPQLMQAFLQAMDLGVFSDEERENLNTSTRMLSEQEAVAELQRLARMGSEDSELLTLLTRVKDADTAKKVAPQLTTLAQRAMSGCPTLRLTTDNFPSPCHGQLLSVCRALEPLLWRIRTEIVRIVGLPGYDSEQFDVFSDALDSVYESLSKTHSECFDEVFDASFRTDLDDALHEGLSSKPQD